MEVDPPKIDHYSSFLPCKYSTKSESIQHQCMLSVDITKSFVKFNIYDQKSDSPIPTEFDFKKYSMLLVSSSFCTFVNSSNQDSTTFYFFNENINDTANNNNNLRRFIFSLADAGMLSYDPNDRLSEIYKNVFIFRFIPDHSFIPDGIYSFVYNSIYQNVRAICISHVKSIMQLVETPFNPKFLEFIFPSVRSVEKQRISSAKSNRKTVYDSNFLFLHQLKIIHKVLKKSSDDNIYDIFKADLEKIEKTDNHKFKIIDEDCEKFNQLIKNKKKNQSLFFLSQINTDKWNEKLSSICSNVCKIHVLSENSKYQENFFLIAARIALFFKNGDNIESLSEYSLNEINDDEIETFKNKLSSLSSGKTDDEFELMVFIIYKSLLNAITDDTIRNLAFDFSMDIFEYFAPSTKAFFVSKKIRSFEWIENDVKEFFINTLKSPWIFWNFILKTNNPEKAYKSLIASIMYNSISKLINQNIVNEDSIADFWPNLQRGLQNDVKLVQNVVDVATYIYDGSAVQNSF